MNVSRSFVFRGLWFIVAIISAFCSYKYSHFFMPILDMNISVDRSEVIHSATKAADAMQVDVAVDDVAVEFTLDHKLQSYVELEAGGKAAFADLVKDGNFYPCQWHVRFFQEKRIGETHVWFSPEGKKIGYRRVFSEDVKMPSLSKSKAQYLLEKEAPDWMEDFCKYELIEYESETQKTGRVDHSFVYQRSDIVVGKGYYQLKLQVVGNEISGVIPSIKIPDNFQRRFEQMRSNNMLLTYVTHFLYRFLYLFIFALLALIILYRQRWLLWKKSLWASCFVAGCYAVTIINDLSIAWIHYSTFQAFSSFVMFRFLMAFIQFAFVAGMLFIGLVAAENAGRFVYKNHMQFWKIFTLDALASYEVFWQVIYGYLYAMTMFGLAASFYYVATYHWGWWSPIQMLADPNILATYVPWLRGFGTSLLAGFMEEVTMRALPLSVILLLCQKSKNKWGWFVFVFVLQILIFSAAHAFYPMQPFYFRVVELILPSLGFGLLYYFFGLLPGVVAHYLFDLLLFSLPILVSNMLLQKIFVYVLLLLPLIIVFTAVVIKNKFQVLSASFYAKSWKAPVAKNDKEVVQMAVQEIPKDHKRYLCGLGIVSVLSLFFTFQFQYDTACLQVTKSEAVSIAQMAVRKEVGQLSEDWQAVTQVYNGSKELPSKCIWQMYGKNVYDKLQGKYINDPAWLVRFINYSLDVEDRKEEFKVLINAQGGVVGVTHILPEHGKGEDLSESAAKKIAYAWLYKKYNLSIADVELLSHDTEKFDHRRDWEFVFEDLQEKLLLHKGGDSQAQARMTIKVSGDKVTRCAYSIYPPEDFKRKEQAYAMMWSMIMLIAKFLMFGVMGCGAFIAAYKMRKAHLNIAFLGQVALFIGATSFLVVCGGVSDLVGRVMTSQPFYHQIIQNFMMQIMNMPWLLLLYTVLIVAGFVCTSRTKKAWSKKDWLVVTSMVVIAAAGQCLLRWIAPCIEPSTTHYFMANSFMPLLYLLALIAQSFIMYYALFTALYFVMNSISQKKIIGIIGQLVIAMIGAAGTVSFEGNLSIAYFIASVFAVGLFIWFMYQYFLRYDFSLMPFLVVGMMIGSRVVDIVYGSYVYAGIYNAIAIAMLFVFAWGARNMFYRKIN